MLLLYSVRVAGKTLFWKERFIALLCVSFVKVYQSVCVLLSLLGFEAILGM